MEIIIIILASLILLGLIAFFIYEVKSHKEIKQPELDLKEIWEIQHKLNDLNWLHKKEKEKPAKQKNLHKQRQTTKGGNNSCNSDGRPSGCFF